MMLYGIAEWVGFLNMRKRKCSLCLLYHPLAVNLFPIPPSLVISLTLYPTIHLFQFLPLLPPSPLPLIDKADPDKDAKKDHRRANQVISEMPKTDKEIRKEKRKKSKERQDRREQRQNEDNKVENVSHFDIAPR